MTPLRKLLLGTLGLVVVVAGCTAAAHLKQLQAPAVLKAPPLRIPATDLRPAAQPAPRMQLGVDIDWYTYPGQQTQPAIAATIAYIRSLHANAVSVSFPFFQHPGRPAYPSAGPATPTPAQIASFARAARRGGLFVTIRPLLDETALGESRTQWSPPRPRVWFRAYRQVLLPYARMAQAAGISGMFIGAEFTRFGRSPYWAGLAAALRKVYRGRLLYAANWGNIQAHPRDVSVTVDAYPPMPGLPATARQGRVTAAWDRYDRTLPRGAVESEVGIDAVAGAYVLPFVHHWPTSHLDPAIQRRWFTAACRAAVTDHLGGIYFWSLGLSTRPAAGPTPQYQGAWGGSASAEAVSRCFQAVVR